MEVKMKVFAILIGLFGMFLCLVLGNEFDDSFIKVVGIIFMFLGVSYLD